MSAYPPMKIRATLPYFGGKRAMASDILDLLCPDVSAVRQYFEPFHGSLAVLLELRDRGYAGPAVVNDLHELTHNLATVLSTPESAAEIAERLAVGLCHESAMRESAAYIDTHLGERGDGKLGFHFGLAFHHLRFSWLHRSGMAGTEIDWSAVAGGFAARWTSSGGDPAARFAAMRESIPGWWSRIQRTTFLCRDAIDVLAKVPDKPGVAIYLDPPYLRGSRSGGEYAVDFEDASGGLREHEDDHARLAAAARRFGNARVAVSYYDDERLARLYPERDGWRAAALARNRNLSNARQGSEGADSPEVLVCNFELPQAAESERES